MACRVLKVSRSGYYEWRGRPESPRATRNRELTKIITRVHEESRGSYGWPRVYAELRLGLGEQVNHKRVRRLMREAGLQGIYRRYHMTVADSLIMCRSVSSRGLFHDM